LVDPSFCFRQVPDSLNPDTPFVGDVGGVRSGDGSELVGVFEKKETDDAARILGCVERVASSGTLSCIFGASVGVMVADIGNSLGSSEESLDIGLARLLAARLVEDPILSLSTASFTDPS